MKDSVKVTVGNALDGLLLTPDMGFFASELKTREVVDAVIELHSQQVTAARYEQFADVVSDIYSEQPALLYTELMVCAALARGYHHIVRWRQSAVQTAINIHLNTIGAADHAEYPRTVPYELIDLRVAKPEHINRDVLWRILMTEPWLSYAERARAQYGRMMKILSRVGLIEQLPEVLQDLITATKPQALIDYDRQQADAKRSIKRAYKLFDRLFGNRNLRALLEHKTVVLMGHLYHYALYIDPGDLFYYTANTKTGMPPVHTVVQRKSDQVALCTMCLYFRDTPLIDHLIAFSLHLKTEENELDMLRHGQMQHMTSAFYRDPVLPALKGLSDPVQSPPSFISNISLHANGDEEYEPLRLSLLKYDCDGLVHELLGYPATLMQVMRDAKWYSAWDFIQNDEDEVSRILDRAKQCFR